MFKVGVVVGYVGLFGVIVMLSFYLIVVGWMFVYVFELIVNFFGFIELSNFLYSDFMVCNFVFILLMFIFIVSIILKGVKLGIEIWLCCLMLLLLVLLVVLIVYIVIFDGVMDGFVVYLVLDFS